MSALEHDTGDGGEGDLLLDVVRRRPDVTERGGALGVHGRHVDGAALEARHVVGALPEHALEAVVQVVLDRLRAPGCRSACIGLQACAGRCCSSCSAALQPCVPRLQPRALPTCGLSAAAAGVQLLCVRRETRLARDAPHEGRPLAQGDLLHHALQLGGERVRVRVRIRVRLRLRLRLRVRGRGRVRVTCGAAESGTPHEGLPKRGLPVASSSRQRGWPMRRARARPCRARRPAPAPAAARRSRHCRHAARVRPPPARRAPARRPRAGRRSRSGPRLPLLHRGPCGAEGALDDGGLLVLDVREERRSSTGPSWWCWPGHPC